jgi:uncharacterized protein with HEPN domain
MLPSARDYLQHVLDETNYLLTSSENLDKAVFLQDETLRRAYVRSIEIIGEIERDCYLHNRPSTIKKRS